MGAARRVEPNQPRRRHAAEIEQDQREVASRSTGPAVSFPATGRRHGRQTGSKQPAMRPCAPDEIDVFHDRQVGVAAEPFEQLSTQEQAPGRRTAARTAPRAAGRRSRSAAPPANRNRARTGSSRCRRVRQPHLPGRLRLRFPAPTRKAGACRREERAATHRARPPRPRSSAGRARVARRPRSRRGAHDAAPPETRPAAWKRR